MKGKYPLEALQSVRKLEVERCAVERSQRANALVEARVALESVENGRRQLETELRAASEREQQALEHGTLQVADLERMQAWRSAQQSRLREFESAIAAARTSVVAAEKAESDARQRLALADANEKALEQHREGWEEENQAQAELKAEEASLTVWTAKRYGPRRG